jgi:Domain of unknown function (DUF6458)
MGFGAALAFIAVGAILAFATHFTVSGVDVQTVGWILMLVGVAGLVFTLAYLRPRRRAQLTTTPVEEEPVYLERPATVEPQRVVREPVDPVIRPTARPVDPDRPDLAP